MQELPKVCLVGAGSSGIAVVKALWDRAIPFDCYEKSDRVGGNWVFKNKNGMSSAYRSLHINTSRTRMQYADFPMPEGYPDFPHHELIARYFDAYVDHFGFRHKISFETGVQKIERERAGGYRGACSTTAGPVHYDAIAVANGHHWLPAWPEPAFPGEFSGIQMHSHYYIDPGEPHDLVDKRVVVLGMGNSAMDIACELCRPGVAQKVFLAARRGAWVIPKYILGKPLDSAVPLPAKLPLRVRGWIAPAHLPARGRPHGGLRPARARSRARPGAPDDLQRSSGARRIGRHRDQAEHSSSFAAREVAFADGSVEKVDAIIYSTGYKVSFPFFDESFVSAPGNDLPLFRRVFKPGVPDLFFFGLLQPLGAIMPIAEAQGKWVAEYLTGTLRAARRRRAMQRDMEAERKAMFERYVPSRRHTMQVDFDDYMAGLSKELVAGRKRADARASALADPRACRAPRRGGTTIVPGHSAARPQRDRAAARGAAACPSTAASRPCVARPARRRRAAGSSDRRSAAPLPSRFLTDQDPLVLVDEKRVVKPDRRRVRPGIGDVAALGALLVDGVAGTRRPAAACEPAGRRSRGSP